MGRTDWAERKRSRREFSFVCSSLPHLPIRICCTGCREFNLSNLQKNGCKKQHRAIHENENVHIWAEPEKSKEGKGLQGWCTGRDAFSHGWVMLTRCSYCPCWKPSPGCLLKAVHTVVRTKQAGLSCTATGWGTEEMKLRLLWILSTSVSAYYVCFFFQISNGATIKVFKKKANTRSGNKLTVTHLNFCAEWLRMQRTELWLYLGQQEVGGIGILI